jgi:hypothetical protein
MTKERMDRPLYPLAFAYTPSERRAVDSAIEIEIKYGTPQLSSRVERAKEGMPQVTGTPLDTFGSTII